MKVVAAAPAESRPAFFNSERLVRFLFAMVLSSFCEIRLS